MRVSLIWEALGIPLTHCIVTYSLYLIVGLGLVQRSVPRLSRQRRNTWLCQYQGHAESRWHAKAGNAAFLLKSYKSSTPGTILLSGQFGDYASVANIWLRRLMGDSVFCLVPRGRAAWSVRFFESLWAGCVPVLLSDHYQPSFDQLFDATERLGWGISWTWWTATAFLLVLFLLLGRVASVAVSG